MQGPPTLGHIILVPIWFQKGNKPNNNVGIKICKTFKFFGFPSKPILIYHILFEFPTFERSDRGKHLRIKLQLHATGVIANNVQYIWLIVVIYNPKMLQPNYNLDNSIIIKITQLHM